MLWTSRYMWKQADIIHPRLLDRLEAIAVCILYGIQMHICMTLLK